MRRTLLILTMFGLLLSCRNTETTKVSSDTSSIRQKVDTIQMKSQRQLLIEELKRLQTVFLSKDKQKIASIFLFPVADTTLGIYIDDSTYLEQYRKNGDRTTKAMFIKYFPQVYRDMQLDQFNQLFKYINVDSLNRKDSLVNEVRSSKEPCYKFYNLYVDKGNVTLEFGTNTNLSYVDKAKKAEDDESFGDECEFASIWWFSFDGKKLHFVKQMAAG